MLKKLKQTETTLSACYEDKTNTDALEETIQINLNAKPLNAYCTKLKLQRNMENIEVIFGCFFANVNFFAH